MTAQPEPFEALSDMALHGLLEASQERGTVHSQAPRFFAWLEGAAAREAMRRKGEAVDAPEPLVALRYSAEELYAIAEATGKLFVATHEMRRRASLGEELVCAAIELETTWASISEWALAAVDVVMPTTLH